MTDLMEITDREQFIAELEALPEGTVQKTLARYLDDCAKLMEEYPGRPDELPLQVSAILACTKASNPLLAGSGWEDVETSIRFAYNWGRYEQHQYEQLKDLDI